MNFLLKIYFDIVFNYLTTYEKLDDLKLAITHDVKLNFKALLLK